MCVIIYSVGRFLSRKRSKSNDIYDEDGNDFDEVVAEEKNEDMDLNTTSKQNPGEQQHCLEDSAGPSGSNSDSPSNKKAESNHSHQVSQLMC